MISLLKGYAKHIVNKTVKTCRCLYKMKNKKYNAVRIVSKSNTKIVERGKYTT